MSSSFWVPPARIHLLRHDDGVEEDAPSVIRGGGGGGSSESESLVGGSKKPHAVAKGGKVRRRRSSSPKSSPKRRARNSFELATLEGTLVLNSAGTPFSYVGAEPAMAAARAFSAFMRSTCGSTAYHAFEVGDGNAQGARLLTDMGFDLTDVPPSVAAALADMRSAADPAKRIASEEETEYRAVYWHEPACFAFRVGVCLVRPGKSLRRYVACYEPVLRPNVHEVRKCITKAARARHVPADRAMPPVHVHASIINECGPAMSPAPHARAKRRRIESVLL